MCGIVGYVGKGRAKSVILHGLENLEYRGYDSAGIAIFERGEIAIEKKKGKLEVLKNQLNEINFSEGDIGIGHTRWATHGKPLDINSHPHLSKNKSVAVVHNGIIENYKELKDQLIKEGFSFSSETDTEVVAHLFEKYFSECKNLLEATKKTISTLKGSFALGIIHKNFPETLICVRKDSPLILGVSENEKFIASDVPAILKFTNEVIYLENFDIAFIQKNSFEIFDKNFNPVKREKKKIQWSFEEATKNGFPHFMLKEIFEQPKSIEETLNRIVKNYEITFEDFFSEAEIRNIKNIHIVACGTAYHAGLQGKYFFKNIAKIPSEVDIASEYRYSNPFANKNTLAIFLSQSGETLDTISALKEAKKLGAKTLAITNVVGSTISREADKTIYTMAGPEISVASTKAYTTQVVVLNLLSLYFGEKFSSITLKEKKEIIDELYNIPKKITNILTRSEEIHSLSKKIINKKNGFYVGRGLDSYIAVEGSLKMKEITYIHTEAFPAGELKHGSIALIDEGTLVVGIASQKELMDKTISNLKEVKARGAEVFIFGNNLDFYSEFDYYFELEETLEILKGILNIVPLQLLAYYTSIEKGIDVDKPKNLAKSVTVE